MDPKTTTIRCLIQYSHSSRLYHTTPYHTILYYTIPYETLLYSTLLYSTLLYSTLLYSTLLYSTLLHYTIPDHAKECGTIIFVILEASPAHPHRASVVAGLGVRVEDVGGDIHLCGLPMLLLRRRECLEVHRQLYRCARICIYLNIFTHTNVYI